MTQASGSHAAGFKGIENGFALRLGHACAAKGIGLEQLAWFWCRAPGSVGMIRRSHKCPPTTLTTTHRQEALHKTLMIDAWKYLVWIFEELPKVKVTVGTFEKYTPAAYAKSLRKTDLEKTA